MLRALLAGAALLLVAPSALAAVYPYESQVDQGSDNNRLDVSADACSPTTGCFDRKGNPCSASPGQTCDLARVPAGRCSEGTSFCIWPQGAGSCNSNPAIPCIADSQCPSGTCNLATNNPACACDPNAPADAANGEYTICGGLFARCSDGDPLGLFGGHPDATCTENGLTGNSLRSGCGDAAGGVLSPRFDLENPSRRYTPQRDPGGGAAGTRPMRRVRSTQGMDIQAPDPFGIRRMSLLGRSTWEDFEYGENETTASYNCDPPLGHDVRQPVTGTCAIGGAFCTSHTHCTVGPCNHGEFCHEAAGDDVGFVFTARHDPAAIAAAGQTGKCPPDCFIDYDFDTFEQEAIETIGRQDRDAGRQVALDHMKGRKYHAGSSVLLRVAVTLVWGGDTRCYLGGDPFRANPADDKIGRCSGSTTACAENLDCPPTEACRFCGGTHSSDPEYGGLASSIDPSDAALALPPGYSDEGYDELDLMAPGGVAARRRLGGITGVSSSSASRVETFAVNTTGVAAAEFKDHTCPGAPDFCTFGQAMGGPPGATTRQQKTPQNVGIGTGGTFFNGTAFPAGGACCDTGGNITWRPEHPSTPVGALTRVSDFGSGGDGIPGCFGDNDEASNGASACNEKLGDPNVPGNTGSDDVAIQYPNPNLSSDPNAPPTLKATSGGYVSPPSEAVEAAYPGANLPTLSYRSATARRDVELLAPDAVDSLTKTARTYCPIVGVGPQCSPGDSDGDGIGDFVDNCRYVPNPGQQDTGGIGTSTPDGIGNACQCGDVTDNGIANGQDGNFMTRHALGYNDPLFKDGGKCDINRDGRCNGPDGTFTTRAALGYLDPLGLAPRAQHCHNANPAAPPCPTCRPCPFGTCS